MGRATAFLFADEGARVAVLDLDPTAWPARSSTRSTVRTATRRRSGSSATSPIRRHSTVAVERAVDEFGGIDILVNNAGVALAASVEMNDGDFEDAWRRTIDVNLLAHVRLVRRCLPHLARERLAADRQHRVHRGDRGHGRDQRLHATKAGVVGLTKSLAVELGKQGVTVNCVCPGPIETGMTSRHPRRRQSHLCPATRPAAALRRARGGGPHDASTCAFRRAATSPARSSPSTAA